MAAIDGFKLCNKLRKEYIKVQKEGEGCELLDELLGNEQEMEEVDENIYFFEKMFDRSTAMKDGKIVPNAGCDEEYDEALNRVKEALNELNDYKDSVAKKYSCSVIFQTFENFGENCRVFQQKNRLDPIFIQKISRKSENEKISIFRKIQKINHNIFFKPNSVYIFEKIH